MKSTIRISQRYTGTQHNNSENQLKCFEPKYLKIRKQVSLSKLQRETTNRMDEKKKMDFVLATIGTEVVVTMNNGKKHHGEITRIEQSENGVFITLSYGE